MNTTCVSSLSIDERVQFDRDGYLLVRHALAHSELTAASAAVGRLRERNAAPVGRTFNAFNVVEEDDAFLDLMDHASVLGRLSGLLGTNLQLLMSQAMVRPPTPQPALGWHHDGPKPYGFPSIDGRAPLLNAKVGWFLTDLTQDNLGNLMVVPGSHTWGVLPKAGDLEHSAHETTELDVDMPGAVQVHAAAGDAIIFHNGLWHAVAASTAKHERVVLYYAYGPSWLRLNDRVASSPALVRRSSPVRRQLLGALSRPEDHGGMHPGEAGAPLLSAVEGRPYQVVMEDNFWREIEFYRNRGA